MGVALRGGPPHTQAMNQIYIETARLMTRVVPLVFFDETFALKGGMSPAVGRSGSGISGSYPASQRSAWAHQFSDS